MSFGKISWRQFFHPKTFGMKMKMSGANFFGATTFAKTTLGKTTQQRNTKRQSP
jgi:hypothetical protein